MLTFSIIPNPYSRTAEPVVEVAGSLTYNDMAEVEFMPAEAGYRDTSRISMAVILTLSEAQRAEFSKLDAAIHERTLGEKSARWQSPVGKIHTHNGLELIYAIRVSITQEWSIQGWSKSKQQKKVAFTIAAMNALPQSVREIFVNKELQLWTGSLLRGIDLVNRRSRERAVQVLVEGNINDDYLNGLVDVSVELDQAAALLEQLNELRKQHKAIKATIRDKQTTALRVALLETGTDEDPILVEPFASDARKVFDEGNALSGRFHGVAYEK